MVLKRTPQTQISLGYCDTRTGQRVYPPPPVDQMSDLLPDQVPPPRPDVGQSQNPEVRLTCNPPLGQATTIPRDQSDVLFSVSLARPLYGPEGYIVDDRAEIVVWHNHNGPHDWEELKLEADLGDEEVWVFDQITAAKPARKTDGSEGKPVWVVNETWDTGRLRGRPKHGHAVQFTVKYRLRPSDDWRWVKDDLGVEDGELLYRASSSVDLQKHDTYHLTHFFDNISSDIEVETAEPECSNTILYCLTAPVPSASGEESGYANHRLGKAKDCSRWFALVRLWSPWLAPRHGSSSDFKIDKDGVLLSFLRNDGMHVVCLALSGIDDVLTTFIHGDSDVVEIKGRNDRETKGTARVLVSVAEEFEVANAAVMYHARKMVTDPGSSGSDLVEAAAAASEASKAKKKGNVSGKDDVEADWLEEWYDGLTYCTWNGLGQALTQDKILDALDSLSKNDINITNLIVDDNWQTLNNAESSQFLRGWSDFEANSSGFPNGLSGLTQEVRKRYEHIEHIAVWHALLGYWGGIDPDGNIAKEYKTIEVEKEPGVAGGTFTVVAAEDAQRMYNDFYSFLKNSGITAVKTDAQFFLDTLAKAPERRAMMNEYQDAWTIGHLRHFTARAISCMSQIPQNIFHTLLPLNRPQIMLRNSDDFFPEVEASHAWHIFCNAHNSLLTQHLNVLPDWDMFQTSHDWAAFHAAARCVSGGPVYITDKPGEHDLGLIGSMCAQTVQGKTVILRPRVIGRTINPYNGYEAQALLKVGTYVGATGTGSSIMGVFNVTKGILREFIPLGSFMGTETGEYILGSYRLGELDIPMKRGDEKDFIGVEMGARGWDILTAYAVQTPPKMRAPSHTQSSAAFKVAILGLLGKMTGAAATRYFDINVENNGRCHIFISLKALGVVGIWMSDLAGRSVKDTIMVTMYGKVVPLHCVRKSEGVVASGGKAGVLEIDVARAWRESGEVPGWSNQAEVDVFIR